MATPTSTVFGRPYSVNPAAAHPYEGALAAWQRSGDVTKMALACNIRHDHRVSPERENQFDNFCHQPRTAGDLEQAIYDYFSKKIRTRRYPHFVYHELNAQNIIHGHGKLAQKLAENLLQDSSPVLNKDVLLLRVLDLNGLIRPYRSLLNVRRRKPGWKDTLGSYYSIPRKLTPKQEQAWVDVWLKEMLDHADEPRRERFVEAVLDLLCSVRHRTAFQPTWATTLEAFEPHALTQGGEPNPDRWVQLMGMGRNPPGHWLIALAYTVGEAGTLVRPTQLDGGWYEYHFPSPARLPLESGGLAMDLRLDPAPSILLPEYIHKEIEHTPQHWNDAERLLGQTSEWQPSNLVKTRRIHQRLLASLYQTDAYASCPNRGVCRIC
ncbi:MAG TPA: hypothetical protein VGP08_18615 [Pyrinomonadaceae bacterium]|jgi:hypothetical protein|nr:hypothetical protein [Pyrinomonadaceae bacterium]